MFTGLVADVGRVEGVDVGAESARLTIATRLAAELREGDSLAVNGVCLTVGPPAREQVEATAVAETLARTTLGALRRGEQVHLEPALSAGDPLGGHIVQGHVDGVGRIAGVRRRGVSLELEIAPPPVLLRYVVEKGSIAVDGVSLTVAVLGRDRFGVALVPHTLERTLFARRTVGSEVNLEVDILAKYVERMLQARAAPEAQEPSRLTEEWLREHGF